MSITHIESTDSQYFKCVAWAVQTGTWGNILWETFSVVMFR